MMQEQVSPEEHFLSLLSRFFIDSCRYYGLQTFTSGTDRHGSLVWEAGWQRNGSRYLTLSATDTSPTSWHIQLWAAAANDEARTYSRKLTYDRGIDMSGIGITHNVIAELTEAFLRTIAIADAIQPAEPDEIVVPGLTHARDRHGS